MKIQADRFRSLKNFSKQKSENIPKLFIWCKVSSTYFQLRLSLPPQEDFSDLDDVTGGNPITGQPTAGQAGGQMPVYAMPPPNQSANPLNPFTGAAAATESTGLNQGGQPTYTPGK